MVELNTVTYGDCREVLKDWVEEGVKVQMVVTSPPYFSLRNYLDEDDPEKIHEIGVDVSLEEYIRDLEQVFGLVKELLADDGLLFLNIGDGYNGSGGAGGDYNAGGNKEGQRRYKGAHIPSLKKKDLIGVPWSVAFALREQGWYLRSDCIWHKANGLFESVRDRCPRNHEYIFMLAKSSFYYFDADTIREPHSLATIQRVQYPVNDMGLDGKVLSGRERTSVSLNPLGKRKPTVWTLPTSDAKGEHSATFPERLPEICI